jgi:hypothetical protein
VDQPSARDIGHEAWTRGRETRRIDARTHVIENRSRIATLFRELRIEPLAEDFGPRAVAGCSLDLIPILENMVERL